MLCIPQLETVIAPFYCSLGCVGTGQRNDWPRILCPVATAISEWPRFGLCHIATIPSAVLEEVTERWAVVVLY